MHGIYGCVDDNGDIVYTGSTGKELSKLEWNHRNYWRFEDGYESNFRKALKDQGSTWKFIWIQELRNISRRQCEIEEGALIRYIKPKYNKDLYPFEQSVRRGRMEAI